ncbi:PREDICTED: PRAME family member 12-like [Propithecus coquereli]|uniref:PRAME family member 12-like n=1 Tax=Propithecus coquereli TaxID=379532 RepID=UPI00063F94E6|nr:PREDICTED: PRAME family member 12-like [Propithecus coquereli]
MSVQDPPRLLQLAGQSLLRDEAVAIPALEELPTELFPPLFMEAFTKRRSKTLTAMVQAWPFTRLPLGSLMLTPDLETLRVVLDGLDVLLAQKVRPRRWKLQVLDLRNVDENFWTVWSGDSAWSSTAVNERKTARDCPRMGRQQPIEVFRDFYLTGKKPDEFLTYLILWVKKRKDFIHLCCKKLVIVSLPVCNITIRKVLEMVDLDCIQEVEMNSPWELSTLARFAPYLGQMRHLGKLVLFNIYVSAYVSPEEKEQILAQFTSQFLKLDNLRKLYTYTGSCLEGRLHQVFRCLKTPLETFLITDCVLSASDWENLFCWPSFSQLKELHLRGIALTHFSPERLQLMLEKVAGTVQSLLLEDCGIVDSQLNVIVPTLSRCCQLTTVSIGGNPISMAALENLLRHTTRLSKLSLEIYPAPQESYDAQGALNFGKFVQFRAELMEILRDLRQPKTIMFSTVSRPYYGDSEYDPIMV